MYATYDIKISNVHRYHHTAYVSFLCQWLVGKVMLILNEAVDNVDVLYLSYMVASWHGIRNKNMTNFLNEKTSNIPGN